MHSRARSPVWQLQKHVARLQLDELCATVDLTRPAEGLFDVRAAGTPLPEARLLGIDMPSFTPGDAKSLAELHARGPDVVAAYQASPSWPVRTGASWWTVAAAGPHALPAAIELRVSVTTELLDSRPGLAVQTVLPAAEVLRLVDADSARFEPCTPTPDSSLLVEPGGGPGCLVLRLPGSDVSYAEMVHPADFRTSELSLGTDPSAAVQVRHRLFCEPLEKGVILRARVRGTFVPRKDDTQTAAACYVAFAAAEPPLGG